MDKPKASVAYANDQIEWRLVSSLIPSARNVRIHDQEHVNQIMSSIEKWGWTIPILVDEQDEIIAGHGRVLAAQQLAIGEVPVLVARNWTKQQKLAYAIADNKLTENGEWNEAMLRDEIKALLEDGQDELIHLTGFSELEIQNLIGDEVDPNAEWQGMPEFDQPDTSYRSIVIHFQDEAAIREFALRVGQPIEAKTKYIWFPKVENDRAMQRHYAASEDQPEPKSET